MAFITKRNIVIGVLVVGVAVALSYRFASNVPPSINNESGLIVSREVSLVTSWEVPNGVDHARFTLGLDSDGAVVAVKSEDSLKRADVDAHLEEFSQGLLLVIGGKKLSELGPVDRIGTSSLTTAAFNAALPDLQAQL